jgi:histidine triad (HIT) family protein
LTVHCIVCQKHQNFSDYVGAPIAERGGLVLAHFPFLLDERAAKGHLIIEPRRHITDLTEMNDAEANALGGLARDAVAAIKKLLHAEHVYFFRINDKVPHLHFHLVPRYAGTPKEFWGPKIMEWPGREALALEQIRKLSRELQTQ